MIRKHWLAVATLGLVCGPEGTAHAFCRTTTCDPNKISENCQFDAEGCLLTGEPLAWRSNCVTIGVHELGSPSNGFDYDDVAPVVEQAFAAWLEADCGSGHPSISVELLGPVACGLSEYNKDKGNANIVLFREDEWPYIGAENAIGLTFTRFDKNTGALWDADIELNAVDEVLSIGDPVEGFDLLSVLTHEAGHFLGMSHAPNTNTTMKPTYDPSVDGTDMRSLEPDDVAGICAIYPPEREPATTSCENRHGFSEDCGADQPSRNESSGCQLGPPTPSPAASLVSAAGALLALGLLARRRPSV
jgi:hypothetical protein